MGDEQASLVTHTHRLQKPTTRQHGRAKDNVQARGQTTRGVNCCFLVKTKCAEEEEGINELKEEESNKVAQGLQQVSSYRMLFCFPFFYLLFPFSFLLFPSSSFTFVLQSDKDRTVGHSIGP